MNDERTTQMPSAAKDFFAYLLLFVLLYTWVTSLGRLIFGYINVAFPEVVPGLARSAAVFEQESQTLKLQFSILLITFPVFVFLYRWITKELAADSMRWESRVRKWLTYLTLFVAAITVIIDVATLFYYFLSGDFTMRFLLKVVTVFLLGGGAFSYFMRDVKNPEENTKKYAAKFAKTLTVVVVLALAITFFVVDPPWVERAKRFDNQRTQDLSSIVSALQAFYEQRGALPTKLVELQSQGPWYVSSLVDPETGTLYEYSGKSANDYELCATFARDGADTAQPGVYPVKPYPAGPPPGDQGVLSFNHRAGHQCFERTAYSTRK